MPLSRIGSLCVQSVGDGERITESVRAGAGDARERETEDPDQDGAEYE